jgi:3-methyladenine DNA glycosylase AlkD
VSILEPINQLIDLFEANRDQEKAIPMQKYMKDIFPFFGIKTPERNLLMKQFFAESNILKSAFQPDFVLALWSKEEREYQYAALNYIEKKLKKLQKIDLPLIEQLITTKSWWDTVDMLAQKPVGTIATQYPEVIPETIEGWAFGDHLWLRRSAILFQLKYKQKTDEKLLYRYIIQNANDSEFFIQKAIGWALREYSKTNPASVKRFILDHTLSNLSIREGSKYTG